MPDNLEPRNEQGQAHGYWEVYSPHGDLWFFGPYVNGLALGYCVIYNRESTINKNYFAR